MAPLGFEPTPPNEDPLDSHLNIEPLIVNMGPSHPATHGTVRLRVALHGENIQDCDVEIGFLHRGFQKSCENVTWAQCLPYTDRLNYVSPMMNNFGFLSAVEKLLGLDIPERAKYIRVIGAELHRIHDHLTATAATSMEIGGFAVFLYAVEARELIMERVTELTGARLTTSYGRIGGLNRDLPEGWKDKVLQTLERIHLVANEVDGLLTRNRIFMDRMVGTGYLSLEDALDFGFTGPCLRASGMALDIRKAHPYWAYPHLDFDVPVFHACDNFDRYRVRMVEIHQSLRLIRQALEKLPDGPVLIDDWRFALPPQEAVLNTIEGTMAHFKLIMEGVQVPAGEVYHSTESANGELGWYLRSDGSGRPYKVHIRAPGFQLLSALSKMVKGKLLSDLIPTFDTINMVGGEVEQ
ncbi:MAG: NADH-quinone oxidoreductase subunit D [Cystobacterineae bacterium]|nr:NADH-quinone oxidoreductase subunit D [Cystobacterineae bacterium]